MNSRQRRAMKYRAKCEVENRENQAYVRRIKTAYERLSTGCSLNVSRATSSPSLREKHESSSACLPEIAIFAAGYRKSKDIVTAR